MQALGFVYKASRKLGLYKQRDEAGRAEGGIRKDDKTKGKSSGRIKEQRDKIAGKVIVLQSVTGPWLVFSLQRCAPLPAPCLPGPFTASSFDFHL